MVKKRLPRWFCQLFAPVGSAILWLGWVFRDPTAVRPCADNGQRAWIGVGFVTGALGLVALAHLLVGCTKG